MLHHCKACFIYSFIHSGIIAWQCFGTQITRHMEAEAIHLSLVLSGASERNTCTCIEAVSCYYNPSASACY